MTPRNFKHFQILELLGRGGMGEVYLALDTTLERKVALKFLPRDLLRDPSAQGRLLDEARSVSRVQHPNIAMIHSIEEDGGIFALCMEYVEGVTLKQMIARGPISLPRIVRIGADTAAALQAAHEQGIVHRDVKPANVMVTRKGQVKVMDFGLALRPERVVNTLGPNTYGTVQYMSPEQARGEKLTAASDIFSFGSLMYELITGRPPFAAPNDLAILHAIISDEIQPMREFRRDVSPALEQIVRGCLKKNPDDRWPSMQAILSELRYVEPTVESGPRDLISELSSGLSERNSKPHHRPDNAGAVGRRDATPRPHSVINAEALAKSRDVTAVAEKFDTGSQRRAKAEVPEPYETIDLGRTAEFDSIPPAPDAFGGRIPGLEDSRAASIPATTIEHSRELPPQFEPEPPSAGAHDARPHGKGPSSAPGQPGSRRHSRTVFTGLADELEQPDLLPRIPKPDRQSVWAYFVPLIIAVLITVAAAVGILWRAGLVQLTVNIPPSSSPTTEVNASVQPTTLPAATPTATEDPTPGDSGANTLAGD